MKITLDLQFINPRRELRTKHAFYRVAAHKAKSGSFVGKQYPEDDVERYGFFFADKDKVINHELHRREDYFKNRFVARYNPGQKKIVYHLSTGNGAAEPWLLDISNKAAEIWSATFKEAGLDIDVEIDQGKRVEVGDIRYNVINFILNPVNTGLGGLGPMLIDPMTGEVVSATSNIHVTHTLALRNRPNSKFC